MANIVLDEVTYPFPNTNGFEHVRGWVISFDALD